MGDVREDTRNGYFNYGLFHDKRNPLFKRRKKNYSTSNEIYKKKNGIEGLSIVLFEFKSECRRHN